MPTLAEIAAGKYQRTPTGTYVPRVIGPITQADDPSIPPAERQSRPVTLADIHQGRASRNHDGSYTWHQQTSIDQPSGGGVGDLAWNTAISAAMGATSGVEAAGAVAEILSGSEGAEAVRKAGMNWTQALQSKMSPEWQAATNRSWGEGAAGDWRWWVSNIAQQIPYMVGTMGVGEGAALGVRGAAYALGRRATTTAAKTVARAADRKIGYTLAGAAAGAGDAASGAAQATDAAGLGDEARLKAMRIAGGVGAIGGAVGGRTLEHVIGGAGGSVLRGVAAQTAGETFEEGTEQFGTELGKASVGLQFDPTAIVEQGLAGGALGLVMGGPMAARGAVRIKQAAKEATRQKQATAEAQALVEREAGKARDDLVKKGQAEVQNVNAAVDERQASATTPMGQLPRAPLNQPPGVWGGAGKPPPNAPQTPEGAAALASAQAKAAATTAPKTRTPPDTRPPIWSQMTKGSALSPGTEHGDQHLTSLQETMAERENQVKVTQVKLDATGTNPASRVKFTAQLRDAKRQHAEAVTAYEDYFKRTSRVRNLPLVGETDLAGMPWEDAAYTSPTDPIADPGATDGMMDDEIQRELDEHFGPASSEDVEDLFVAGPKLRRSQQAKAAAVTRWENARKQAAANSVTQMPVPNPPTRVNSPITQTSEASAVVSRVPKSTKQPTKVKAALEPIPQPAATVAPAPPAVAGQATPEAPASVTPSPAGVVSPSTPPVEAQAAGQPGAPSATSDNNIEELINGQFVPYVEGAPEPQEGGFMAAPPRGRSIFPNMAEVTGEQPPTPILPGVEAALEPTQPRKKNLSQKTPRERLQMVLAQGPRGVDTVLAAIQDGMNNAKDTRTFKLVEALRKAFPNSVKQPLRVIVEDRTLAHGIQGIYDPKADRIYVDLKQAEDAVHAVLHEAVHAALVYKLRTNEGLIRDVTKIMKNAENKWRELGYQPDPAGVYGFGNIEEFASEVLTNSEFTDSIAGLPISEYDDKSLWTQFKRRLATTFGVTQDPNNNQLFDKLLEMVTDGGFLSAEVRAEQLQQLDNLGLSQAAGLLTDFRSMMRQTGVQNRLANLKYSATRTYKAGGRGSVWNSQLPFISMDQLAQSYGDVGKFYVDDKGDVVEIPHDAVNGYTRNLDLRDGHITALRAMASRIDELGKMAATDKDAIHKDLEDTLINSTLWGLWANKDADHKDNAAGLSLPGRADLLPLLNAAWAKLRPMQQDFYRLATFFSEMQLNRDMQDIMVWRAKQMSQSQEAADLLEKLFKDQPLISNLDEATGKAPSDIQLGYNQMVTAAQLQEYAERVGRDKGMDKKAVRKFYRNLRAVQKSFPMRIGPYFPLRRTGEYYSMLRTAERTLAPMDKATYDRTVRDNQLHEDGDLEIKEEAFDPTTSKYTLKVRNIFVRASDSEHDATDITAEKKSQWTARGLTPEATGERSALKSSDVYTGLALQSSSFEALRRDVMDIMSKEVGEEASKSAGDAILKYYLEKLPEGSIKKARMRARLIAGPSRDVLHVFSQYANGAAHFSGQAKYGSKMATAAGSHMDAAIRFLHEKRQTAQANDLQKIQRFLKNRDASYDRAASKEALEIGQDWFGNKVWRKFPQLVTAFLLTGPGTTMINALQGPMIAFPYFAARHNPLVASAAMMKAMQDTTGALVKETTAEVGRSVTGLPSAAKVLVGAQRFTRSIRNPKRSMVERVQDSLLKAAEGKTGLDKKMAQMEADHLHALVMRKKIDFGLTSEVQAMSERASGRWMAAQYLMDAAFVVPQAMETANRINTGLASFRLNVEQVTADVLADASIAPGKDKDTAIGERLVDHAAQAIDQTMWNYSPSNQPSIMRHELLRFAVVFKTFAQRMTYSILHNFVQSFNARTPEERKTAMMFLGGLMGTTFVASGAMGLMALDPIYIMALALAHLFSDDDDPEQALRQGMLDWLGKEWAPLIDTILKGPVYGSNLADLGRAGFPSLINWNSQQNTLPGRIGEAMLGAPGSLMSQMYDGTVAIAQGNVAKGMELITPKAFGINDIMRAMNYAHKGLTDSTDAEFMGPKDVSVKAIIQRGLGIEAPYIASKKAIRRTFFDRDNALHTKRTMLMSDYAHAVRTKDKPARTAAIAAIKKFNHGNKGYAITRANIESSLKNRHEQEHVLAKYGVRATKPGQRKLLDTIQARYGA